MPRQCEVCSNQVSKYTCPQCTVKYCSVACYKDHKEVTCVPGKINIPKEQSEETKQDKEEGELSDDLNDITEDRVDVAAMEKLGESEDLHQLFRNPHLRDIMKGLVESDDAAKLMETAMKEPIFTEFVDECLKIVEPEAT